MLGSIGQGQEQSVIKDVAYNETVFGVYFLSLYHCIFVIIFVSFLIFYSTTLVSSYFLARPLFGEIENELETKTGFRPSW